MATLRLGDIAPDFEAETTLGKIHFHEWLGDSLGVYFSSCGFHTCLYNWVEPLQIILNLLNVIQKWLHCVDGLESHLKWIKDIEEVQNVTLQYPIIADENKEVANLYDMIHPNDTTVRSVL
jgi:alkyl hydroperoxide reductase subunit AhpC